MREQNNAKIFTYLIQKIYNSPVRMTTYIKLKMLGCVFTIIFFFKFLCSLKIAFSIQKKR